MPEWFPSLHEDELFYSAVARYARAMDVRSQRDLADDLFGTKKTVAVFDLPCRFDRFLARLPDGHPLTAEGLIGAHTLLPYYAAFLDTASVRTAIGLMRGDRGSTVHGFVTAASVTGVRPPSALRYCTSCARADRARVGEAYWRRAHQLPGTFVCASHGRPLRVSRLGWGTGRRRFDYESLAAVIAESDAMVDLPPVPRALLHRVARDGAWLLANGTSVPRDDLPERYRSFLRARGLVEGTTLRPSKILERVGAVYPGAVLAHLCPPLGTPERWVLRMLRKGGRGHPLRHLVLTSAFADSAKVFFGPLPATGPDACAAADGPCRNPICPRFAGRAPAAGEPGTERAPHTVTCPHCGFSYRYPNRQYVLARGELWDAELRRLLADPEVTLTQCASRLGVANATVQLRAVRLGVARVGWRGRTVAAAARPSLSAAAARLRARHRDTVRLAVRASPDARRMEVRRRCNAAYKWLLGHDRAWLEGHLPRRRHHVARGRIPHPPAYWRRLDGTVLRDVRAAVRGIVDLRPVRRVTVTEIGNRTGHAVLIRRHRCKLPRVDSYLRTVLESTLDVSRRRLRVAADRFIGEGRVPARSVLMTKAGVFRHAEVLRPDIDTALLRVSGRVRARRTAGA